MVKRYKASSLHAVDGTEDVITRMMDARAEVVLAYDYAALEARCATLIAEVMHYTAGTPHPRIAELEAEYKKLHETCMYTGDCNARNADKANRLESALRRARPYVLNHDCADAAELEALGLTIKEIDLALGSAKETRAVNPTHQHREFCGALRGMPCVCDATPLETPVSTLCAICDQIKELHPASHEWTAKETAAKQNDIPCPECRGEWRTHATNCSKANRGGVK